MLGMCSSVTRGGNACNPKKEGQWYEKLAEEIFRIHLFYGN